ncbi:unnamed protein product [Rotaria socialis]|uniref:Myotubularin phosphatase domain-containing protein n=1 Tax=Rotaria socialis TaxID=392032 RepID=A0A820CZ55_9BILA|nr:unnamed protein product [Rotaria socialis]CAF3571134.1 unnamed protein product [Rotaria socialis]CAF4103480.1 unnamed protein product [Rotaria socialis]CAF4214696.1 unnamed protein product [Rotaria socialis]CAF4269289.1 unnamed protein product [Rotaria socialis]
MSFRRKTFGSLSESFQQQQQSQMYTPDLNNDLVTQNDALQSILPKFMEVVRKLLPQELPFDMYVPNVKYLEGGCKSLIGNLYLSNFRLVFVPDNSTDDNLLICSGNRYIGEYDIPLASIYKINVAPVNARTGFKSFLNENQIQSETRTFTIITRDFRSITFTKCSVTKAYTIDSKNQQVSLTKMEKYIEALKAYSRAQQREQLYLYAAIEQYPAKQFVSKDNRSYTSSKLANRNFSQNEISDLYLGKDEHIRSYMTYDDWRDELYEANEQQWIVDRNKFDKQATIQAEGPYVRLIYSNNYDSSGNLIWHWTHTSQVGSNGYYKRQMPAQKYMFITAPGIGEVTSSVEPNSTISLPATVSSSSSSLSSSFRFNKIKKNLLKPLRRNTPDTPKLISTNESKTTLSDLTDMSQMPPDSGLRRVTTDTNLIGSSDIICDQPFQRYNLSKFPCNLKRLQSSYEKLIEICITTSEDDDDKWLAKLHTCKWLKYVSKALHGAATLAKLLDFKNIKLVGSDTDNSCLMSSLVQILLRPKCRTIKGFCELIVREWVIRGHKFLERFGQVAIDGYGNPGQESPVFLLFLDCVHQLIVQNPFLFEFTDYLLLEFYRNACYCYQHTFVFNDVLERLQVINNYPKHLFVLSSFDFSLYLDPETCFLLKNDASIFQTQPPASSSTQKHTQARIEATVIYPSSQSPRHPNRSVYYVETSTSRNHSIDIPITNGSLMLNADIYDYDTIESPQVFPSDFHVDWRTFNLVLWSKCYCRYDQTYLPTVVEQQLSFEINCLKEDLENMRTKSAQITLDTFENVGHANSWHPQTLVTRV